MAGARDSSQETLQASESLAPTAPTTAPLRARGSRDPFAERVAPLGDEDLQDSGSEYDPKADGDVEDDGDLPLMVGERGNEEEQDLSTWFGDGNDA